MSQGVTIPTLGMPGLSDWCLKLSQSFSTLPGNVVIMTQRMCSLQWTMANLLSPDVRADGGGKAPHVFSPVSSTPPVWWISHWSEHVSKLPVIFLIGYLSKWCRWYSASWESGREGGWKWRVEVPHTWISVGRTADAGNYPPPSSFQPPWLNHLDGLAHSFWMSGTRQGDVRVKFLSATRFLLRGVHRAKIQSLSPSVKREQCCDSHLLVLSQME